MRFFVGVSGFSYASWKGNFYPKDLKSEDFLGSYSRKLNSVEINSSFYAPPSATTVKSWSAKAQDDFRFSIKAPRQITHILKLGKGSSDSAKRLSKTLDMLGPKRGPILFQLPPFMRQDLKLLESFLGETSPLKESVFEFRHESWLSDPTYALLDKYQAGWCIAETEDMKPILNDGKSIDEWSTRIRGLAKEAQEAYVYLRHDETGDNAGHAVRLKEKLLQKS